MASWEGCSLLRANLPCCGEHALMGWMMQGCTEKIRRDETVKLPCSRTRGPKLLINRESLKKTQLYSINGFFWVSQISYFNHLNLVRYHLESLEKSWDYFNLFVLFACGATAVMKLGSSRLEKDTWKTHKMMLTTSSQLKSLATNLVVEFSRLHELIVAPFDGSSFVVLMNIYM